MRETYSRTNHFTHPQPEYAYNLRQVDNHGTVDLHPEPPRRPNSAAAYTNHALYDGDFYEEDRHERAFTKYGKFLLKFQVLKIYDNTRKTVLYLIILPDF
jgi:hypothetical protein